MKKYFSPNCQKIPLNIALAHSKEVIVKDWHGITVSNVINRLRNKITNRMTECNQEAISHPKL